MLLSKNYLYPIGLVEIKAIRPDVKGFFVVFPTENKE
jgi:hypothetical protein